MMTVADVARRLQVTESFVRARLKDGSLKHFVLSHEQGCIRISEEQLQEYLASRVRGGQQTPPAPKRRMPKLKHLR